MCKQTTIQDLFPATGTQVGMLLGKIFIRGRIEALSGLSIGGPGLEFEIGGSSLPVIRDPLTRAPYVPGSGLKGRMRSLTERLEGAFDNLDDPRKNQRDPILWGPYFGDKDFRKYVRDPENEALRAGLEATRGNYPRYIPELYGFIVPGRDSQKRAGRLLVRDAYMTKVSRDALVDAPYTDMPFTTLKPEVMLDRVTSNSKLRHIERVPAGASFNMELVLNVVNRDVSPWYELLSAAIMGLALVQDDALGGHGSRGYGQVRFADLSLSFKSRADYLEGGSGGALVPLLTGEDESLSGGTDGLKTLRSLLKLFEVSGEETRAPGRRS